MRPDPRLGTDLGPYRIESVIGRGGMGVVYLVEQPNLGRKVALKVIAPEFSEEPRAKARFLRESQMAAAIDHPNILPIHEAGELEGVLFIAMRYVEGEDLAKRLAREPLPPDTSVAILAQVAAALDAAHARGLVHRDVKPANILLDPQAGPDGQDHAYLTDFGLTKRGGSEGSLTAVGGFAGTLAYIAPEQVEGGEVDGRSDEYSLACVAFECLTGRPPFVRETDIALAMAHLRDPVPSATALQPALPTAVGAVIARGLAKAPAERYESCSAFVADLRAAIALTATHARPYPRAALALAAVGIAAVVVTASVVGNLPKVAVTPSPSASAGPSASPTLADVPPGVVLLEAATGRQIAHIPTSTIAAPVDPIYADGKFWVMNLEPLSVVEVDAKTGQVGRQLALPGSDFGAFAVDGNTLWASEFSEPVVVKIDLRSGREVDRFDLSTDLEGPIDGFSGGVVAEGSLWLAQKGRGVVIRVDPTTGKVQDVVGETNGSWAITYADGAIWTSSNGGLSRIDLSDDSVTKTDVPGGQVGGYVAAGGGFGWTADESKGVVFKVDTAGHIVSTYQTGLGAKVVSFDDGTLWVANQDEGTVSAIDAITGAVRTLTFGHPTGTVSAGGGTIAVVLGEGGSYEDRIDALEGSVARLFVSGYDFGDLDSATTWPLHPGQTWEALMIEGATCATLVNYSDASGVESVLRPEIAATMPAVSADGRTYTFDIRPGFRFSPPSGEAVTAETFRYSIERALSPKLGDETPGPQFLGDVFGIEAFRDGTADHIDGLKVQGDQLSITLTAPSPDFLTRLALPYFCPVPVDTPFVSGAVGQPVKTDSGSVYEIPSTGPYYVADANNGEYVILKRNPNYGGDRPHAYDAIALREGVNGGLAVTRVESGEWDGVVELLDLIFSPTGELASRWGPASDAAKGGDQRYFPVADGGLLYLELNAGRAPFSDRRLREAVSLALDRRALVAAWNSTSLGDTALPWVYSLPPSMTSASPASDEALGPDVEAAKELVGSYAGTKVRLIASPNDSNSVAARRIKTDLAAIGLDVEINLVGGSLNVIHEPNSPYDMKIGGYGRPDTFDSASLLTAILRDAIPPEWLPASLQGTAETLAAANGPDRQRQAEQVATGAMAQEVPLAVWGYEVSGAFFAPSIGCLEFPPASGGVDLAALCPKP